MEETLYPQTKSNLFAICFTAIYGKLIIAMNGDQFIGINIDLQLDIQANQVNHIVFIFIFVVRSNRESRKLI
jgi:hypothetical protein